MPNPPRQPTPDEEMAKPSKPTVDAEALRGLLKEISDTDPTLSPGLSRNDQPSKKEATERNS